MISGSRFGCVLSQFARSRSHWSPMRKSSTPNSTAPEAATRNSMSVDTCHGVAST